MQHGDLADARARMFGVGGDGGQGLRGGLEQNAIDHRFVLIGGLGEACRQGEDHMEVGHPQQIAVTLFQPSPRGATLTLRAMPIAAGITSAALFGAVGASFSMAARLGRAASFDGTHDAQMIAARMAGLSPAASIAMAAENVANLKPPPFCRQRTRVPARQCATMVSIFKRSSGLCVA